ncbi:hypothetical protein TTHERM_01122700 (macronuclear) [Tetrahymena thermophila SB210]|uniref:Uncharacterized protein n=1 Tax=Tetrahymena thermophila (strain SB210) TaxID=312017 RepID=Q23S19_TETTS|nr:hypothetical protein TTHERM_01122700 [Tetrahymena thermophila SB210]EAR99328.2 hypothetical protein TTHERM_01122700 [Tetrahymena thermophila SB210]|eukprot:XP_001019573.2 hypothetical protein TTHERM_01122700 [Tetrahymena thermophila SB210]
MEDFEYRQKQFLQKKIDHQAYIQDKQNDQLKQQQEIQNSQVHQNQKQIDQSHDYDSQNPCIFFRINYHIRKYILGFITFKQLKRMLYINKQLNQDILSYFRTHLRELHVNDTLRFEMDGYKVFFQNYGQNIKKISIFCQGLDYKELFNSLPDSRIEGVKLIMCPSYWLQQRSFYRLLKLKLSKSLVSIQIQVYMQVNNNIIQQEEVFQSTSQNQQLSLIQCKSNSSSLQQKPVTLEFLNSFWSCFKVLKKISMKEVQTFLDLTNDYNLLLQSIFTTPTLNLTVLKIQNMLIPFQLLQLVQQQQNQNQQQQNNNFLLNPQYSLQIQNNNNNNQQQIQQNYHSLPIASQLNSLIPSPSIFQMSPSQPQQNGSQNNQTNLQQIQQLIQQRQQLNQQNEDYILSEEQANDIQNQIQQIDQQIANLQQNQIMNVQGNNTNTNNQSLIQVLQLNNLLYNNNEIFSDIEDTLSYKESQLFQNQTLNKFKKLQKFKISSTRNSIRFLGINDHTLETLIKLIPKSLSCLEIVDYQNESNLALREKSFSEKIFVQFIEHFNNLSQLSINCYKTRQQIPIFAFLHMEQIYNNLTSLGLASCNGINKEILSSLISKNCSQLQELCMDYTQLEGALETIAQSQTAQLKRISINYCKRITKEEIITFCNSQTQLEYVSFKQIKCFTKKALVPLVNNNYKTLKSVILEGNKIDNTHIAFLLRYCRNIQSLCLRKMDRVDANFSNQLFHVIMQFAKTENYNEKHEKLTYLDISFNQTFNDESISCISQLFPNLYTFILDQCSIRSLTSLLPLKYSINSLNLSSNLIIIKSEQDFEAFCKTLSEFYYLNTIFIEIPNIDRFLKHSNFVWNTKPIIIKESFNMCCYPITRNTKF